MHMAFSMKVTPEIEELTNICLDNSKMDVSLYGQYDVKRGLRDICLLYTSPSPRDRSLSRMPSSA